MSGTNKLKAMSEASRFSGMLHQTISSAGISSEDTFRGMVGSKMHFTQSFFNYLNDSPNFDLAVISLNDSLSSFDSLVKNTHANNSGLLSSLSDKSGVYKEASDAFTQNKIVEYAQRIYNDMNKVMNTEVKLDNAAAPDPQPINASTLIQARSGSEKPSTTSPGFKQ